MPVSLRRSPQPFKGVIVFLAATFVLELVAGIAGLGTAIANGGLALVGSALILTGVTLTFNVNGCADYMTNQIRRDAPYGYDYFGYFLAGRPGGARVPGLILFLVGSGVMADAIAMLLRD